MTVDRFGLLADAAPRISRKPSILFLRLWSAKGRFVSYDILVDEFYEAGDSGPFTPDGVRQVAKHLRRQMPDDWPVAVESKPGIGMRLVFPAGWTWES